MAAHNMGEIGIHATCIFRANNKQCTCIPLDLEICLTLFSALCRIVNSELTYFMGALGSLENINAFRSSLFDVWTVNR